MAAVSGDRETAASGLALAALSIPTPAASDGDRAEAVGVWGARTIATHGRREGGGEGMKEERGSTEEGATHF